MTKHVNHLRGGMTLRSRVLGSASVAAVSVLMLSSAAFAASSPADSNAPIATNNRDIVQMAQVTPEEAAAAAARRAAEDADDDVIVVNGIRSSLEKAIEVKRNADNILDGISAESIGRFPDLNLAESLQRIAGVQIVRDDFRDGKVAIRGITGFSKTQVNGQDLASPNFGGAFVYGIFESSVLSGVDVMKTPRVSFDAGGIAGMVNLKTRGALDFEDDKHLFLSVKGQYEGLNQAFMPDLGMSAGIKNAAGNLGAYVSVGYQEKNFRSDSAKITEYTAIDSTYVIDSFGDGPNAGRSASRPTRLSRGLSSSALDALDGDLSGVTFVPKRARYTSRGTTGDRISIAGGAEWAVNEDLNLKLTGIFAKSKNEQPLNTISLMTFGDRGFRFDILDTQDEGLLGTTATRIRIHSPQMQVQNRIRDQDFQTYALTLDGDWEKGPWNVHGAVHYTAGDTQQSQHQIVSRIESRNGSGDRSFLDNGLVAELNTGSGDPYSFGFSTNRPFSDINTFGWNTTNAPDPVTGVIDNSDHLFAGIFTGSTNNYDRTEEQIALQLDFSREVNFSLIESVDFGVKFKSTKQNNQSKAYRSIFNTSGNNVYDISVWDNSLFQDSFIDSGSGYFGGDVAFPGLQVPNARAALAALTATVITDPNDPNYALRDNVDNLDLIDPETGLVYNSLGTGVYDNTREHKSFYASANFSEEIPTLGINLRGNFGFRYIDTNRLSETSVVARVQNFPGMADSRERVDAQGEADFSHFLPQANIIFDITDDFTVRGSWSETVNYLNPDSIRAGANFNARDTGNGAVVSRFSDRSQLLPKTATAFDIAAEWYNRSGSVIQAAIFTKNLSNTVVIRSICGDVASVPGIAPFVSGTPVFDAGGVCRDDAGTRFNLTRRFNTRDTFRVSGAEFGFTQNLDFLEGFWANFGVTANYTYLKKHKPVNDPLETASRFGEDGNFIGGNILDQLSLSPHSFNFIPYYETDRFGIRLAGNFRSHFVDGRSLGGFLGADRIVDDRMQWDLSASYNINDHLKVGAEVINIFDKDRYEYQGTERRHRNLFSEGRTMTMSLAYDF